MLRPAQGHFSRGTFPPNQQPMTVHPHGNARHQRYIVLTVHDLKLGGIGGDYFFDLIHSIGEIPVIHMDIEHSPLLEFGQVGEQTDPAHAGMPRQDRMGAGTAHGHGGFRQVAHALHENIIADSVVNRQEHADAGNLHIAHDPSRSDVQE